jgi:hypothetical protein
MARTKQTSRKEHGGKRPSPEAEARWNARKAAKAKAAANAVRKAAVTLNRVIAKLCKMGLLTPDVRNYTVLADRAARFEYDPRMNQMLQILFRAHSTAKSKLSPEEEQLLELCAEPVLPPDSDDDGDSDDDSDDHGFDDDGGGGAGHDQSSRRSLKATRFFARRMYGQLVARVNFAFQFAAGDMSPGDHAALGEQVEARVRSGDTADWAVQAAAGAGVAGAGDGAAAAGAGDGAAAAGAGDGAAAAGVAVGAAAAGAAVSADAGTASSSGAVDESGVGGGTTKTAMARAVDAQLAADAAAATAVDAAAAAAAAAIAAVVQATGAGGGAARVDGGDRKRMRVTE